MRRALRWLCAFFLSCALVAIVPAPSQASIPGAIGRIVYVAYSHDGRPPPAGAGVCSDSFAYAVQDSRMGSAPGMVTMWIHPAFSDVPSSNIFSPQGGVMTDERTAK